VKPDLRGVFVTGTDTEVGKTHVSCAMVAAARRRGSRVGVMKPIAAGAAQTPRGLRNDDALSLIAAARGDAHASSVTAAQYTAVNPYCFAAPVSPHIAAAEAGVRPDLARIADLAKVHRSENDWLVVEGAGGWLAPITAELSVSDLAIAVGLPVLVVVGLRLGCLNHAQLTVREIDRSGLPFAGWVANQIDPAMARVDENVSMLTKRLGGPPLARFGFGADAAALAESGNTLIDRLVAKYATVGFLQAADIVGNSPDSGMIPR